MPIFAQIRAAAREASQKAHRIDSAEKDARVVQGGGADPEASELRRLAGELRALVEKYSDIED